MAVGLAIGREVAELLAQLCLVERAFARAAASIVEASDETRKSKDSETGKSLRMRETVKVLPNLRPEI